MNRLSETSDIHLGPGEFYFGAAPVRVRTLLGSCVAITLWHPAQRLGGMCHYLLPSRCKPAGQLDARYADEAMELFLREAARHNTRAQDYQVKLFGGGNMFPEAPKTVASISVADSNVNAAHLLVKRHRLQLSAQDLGRSGHRQVVFDIRSGHVWVRHQCLREG